MKVGSLPSSFACGRVAAWTVRPFHGTTVTAAVGLLPAGDLVDWVLRSGGSVDGVAVHQWNGADGGSGYGLQTAKACPAGAPLITLPPRAHLTFDEATDPRLLALIKRVPAELWGAKLALQLLAKRVQGEASTHDAYISLLPQGFPGLPMFFPPDAVAALQYPPVTAQVNRRCRWLLSFSRDVLAPLRGTADDPFEGAEVDANALGWALGAVTSRAFRTRGPSHPAAMLPLIDMANHSFAPNARVAPAPGGALAMTALRPLAAGEPVLLSYGDLPNDFLLLDYGFIAPNNPHDTVQLRFDRGLIEAAKAVASVGSAGPEDPASLPLLPAWQERALSALQLSGEAAKLEVHIRQAVEAPQAGNAPSGGGGGAGGNHAAAVQPGCPVDGRLLAGARVLCAASARELAGRSAAELGRWGAPLSARNEAAALRTLTGLCAIALSQFSCSAEEDAALLRGGADAATGAPLSGDVQLAVRFRLEKKRLLAGAIAALSARLKGLDGGGAGSGGPRPAAKAAPSKGFGR